MEFSELIEIWFPVASEIAKTNGTQMVKNLLRGLTGGRSRK